MASLHHNKIIFAGDFKEIFQAVQKPHHWPDFECQAEELKRKLCLLRCVAREENRGASFIGQSVTREKRLHSYVAAGPPAWLFEVFVNESVTSDVLSPWFCFLLLFYGWFVVLSKICLETVV